MQVKMTVRYHLTLVRMAIIKSLQIINAVHVEKMNSPTLLMGMKIGAATMEKNIQFP